MFELIFKVLRWLIIFVMWIQPVFSFTKSAKALWYSWFYETCNLKVASRCKYAPGYFPNILRTTFYLIGRKKSQHNILSVKKIVGKKIRHFLSTNFLIGYLKTLIELKKPSPTLITHYFVLFLFCLCSYQNNTLKILHS